VSAVKLFPLLLLLVATMVRAAPPARPSKDELRRFRAAIAEAKKLAKKGKHAAAIAAYDKALAIRPGDLSALTDQGWSAFLLTDLARAERITRQAVAAPGDDRISAAAQYNLGRILELKNDKAGAIAAYQRSLRLRPNRVVREQLGKLDPAAAAAADPIQPRPMEGPFASLADFCKTLEENERDPCPVEGQGAVLTRVGGPYQAVSWIQAGYAPGSCYVAVQPQKGWFVEAEGTDCQDGSFLQWRATGFEVTDLVPGGHREVILRGTQQRSHREDNDPNDLSQGTSWMDDDCEGWMTACGVSKSGGPSCFRLQFGRGGFCGDDRPVDWTWQVEPVFTADGQVEVKGKGKLDADARALLGRRPLAFP
jgi:hypothetical protein